MICSIPGCESKRRARGWCGKHYQRWLNNGDPTKMVVPRQRPFMPLLSDVVAYELRHATRDGDCLLTKVVQNCSGHGRIRWNGKLHLVHRLVLEHKIQRALKSGEQANHTCHRPQCIAPDHLYLGTQAQNVQDTYSREDNDGFRKRPHRVTWEIASQIRDLSAHMTRDAIGEKFGVSRQTVNDIVNGNTWVKARRMHHNLNTEAVMDVRQRLANGEPKASIARRHNVTTNSITLLHREASTGVASGK